MKTNLKGNDFVTKTIETGTAPANLVELMRAVSGLAFVGGSGARALVVEDNPGDYDLFLYKPEYLHDVIAAVKSIGYRERRRKLAATFYRQFPKSLPVQIVLPAKDEHSQTYGTVTDVLSQFAFRAQQFGAYLLGDYILVTYSEAGFRDAIHKRLVATGAGSPLFVMYSALKYAGKGYHAALASIGAIMDDWARYDPDWRAAEINRARWPHGGYRS